MKNFDKFAIYKPCTDAVIISCRLGLWSITGPYNLETVNKAEKKYLQYKAAGKYKNLPKEKSNGSSPIKHK